MLIMCIIFWYKITCRKQQVCINDGTFEYSCAFYRKVSISVSYTRPKIMLLRSGLQIISCYYSNPVRKILRLFSSSIMTKIRNNFCQLTVWLQTELSEFLIQFHSFNSQCRCDRSTGQIMLLLNLTVLQHQISNDMFVSHCLWVGGLNVTNVVIFWATCYLERWQWYLREQMSWIQTWILDIPWLVCEYLTIILWGSWWVVVVNQ